MKKIVWLLLLFIVFSCQEENIDEGIVTDIDGNVYRTVTIGSQVWMAENLKTTRYQNGDKIPNVKAEADWNSLKTGAYCDYDNNPENSEKYGRLYNHYVIGDEREIAPKGWRVPTTDDWWQLLDYMDANYEDVAKAFAAKEGWLQLSGGIGDDFSKNNESGFSAMAGGRRVSNGDPDWPSAPFMHMGILATWWGDTGVLNDAEENIGSLSILLSNHPVAGSPYRIARNDSEGRKSGMSIRCIKN